MAKHHPEFSVSTRVHALMLVLAHLCFSRALVSARPRPVFACNAAANPELASLAFCDPAAGIAARVADLVGRLTLAEKIEFLVNSGGGVARLGIPRYEWWSEALHGVAWHYGLGTTFSRLVPGATSFPQVILTAASFNVSLFEAIGKVVSTEARAMYNVGQAGLTFWSPNVNIFRDPRWGRGQETPGEDPVLTSKYASAFVRGLQQREDGDSERLKVAACCKHSTAYDLDNWKGVTRFDFDAVVTQQDLADTFQPPFKSCVLEGNVASVMCSYQKLNGMPTCADADLLTGVIREEWKLNGYIVSDCDSISVFFKSQHYTNTPEEAAAKALLAGLDLNCGDFLRNYTEGAIKAGLVDERVIDRAISNNLATLMRLGFFDGDPRRRLYGKLGPKDVCTQENQELAREAARQGIVLLKNSAGSLPLSPSAIKSLAVIGPNANATLDMIGNYEGIPCQYTTPLQGLAALVAATYAPGCANVECLSAQVEEAKGIAASADATVLVMGANQLIEREGLDRINLTLPGQQQFVVTEVANAAKGPVILIVMSGGGMDVQFAKDHDKITSILWVGYPGQAGGAAIADVIFGSYNPSGRLPMSWYPESYAETVPMTDMNMRPDPSRGYPGRTYRFYTGPVVYTFGDGLSYTNFNHYLVEAPEQLRIPLEDGHACLSSECNSLDAVEESCQNLAFDIHLTVENGGEMSGGHTVFLFSSPPPVHNSPQKTLLDFEKVFLASQTQGVVSFSVDVCKDLSVVDELGSRKIALGTHLLHVGSLKHSLDLRV